MNSATSKTEGDPSPFAVWQLYALLGMLAAAAAVWVAKNTHPAALILLSAAAVGAGVVALAVHHAAAAFVRRSGRTVPLDERERTILEREKALALRSIKELEFDRAMGKIGDADFAAISSRLRARALTLMQDLERADAGHAGKAASGRAGRQTEEPAAQSDACPNCGTVNDPDAKFCKSCGRALV